MNIVAIADLLPLLTAHQHASPTAINLLYSRELNSQGVMLYRYSPPLEAWIRHLHASGFVFRFDWPQWQQQALAFEEQPGLLEQADLASLRRLMTHLLRQEQFYRGSLVERIESGLLEQILQRLVTLSEQEQLG